MKKITEITVDGLKELLEKHGLPVHLYGQGKANGLPEMSRCINRGDFYLVEEEGKLRRELNVVGLDVFNHNNTHHLYEEMQILPDGRSRDRRSNMDASIGEMVPTGMDFSVVVKEKAMKEEFPILLAGEESLGTLKTRRNFEKKKKSPSYPELISIYHIHLFSIRLMLPWFPLEKIMVYEEETGITTLFNWEWVE